MTIVAADSGARQLALQATARACAATTWHWRGRDAGGADDRLWTRLNDAQALLLAPDLDAPAARALRDRLAVLPPGLRVLASSPQPLPDTAAPWLDAAPLTALSSSRERAPARATLRRPALVRRPHDSAK